MATVDYQDKDKENQEEDQSLQNQPQSVVDPNVQNQGQSGSAYADGSLNTGAGAGGQGNWTNIQAYLSANQNDKSSENLANGRLNSSFAWDQARALDGAQSALNQADKDLKSKSMSPLDANNIITQAQGMYQYGMPQSESYTNQINQIRNSLGAQYGGPQSYNYGISKESQDYGKGLQNSGDYQGMLNNIYQKSAGGTMGSGMLALQNQLDSQNPGLQALRATQLKNYNNMVSSVNDTNSSTNQKLDEIKAQYDPNNFNSYKNVLNRHLSQTQNNSYAGVNQAANQWNSENMPVGDNANNILNAAKSSGVYDLYQKQNQPALQNSANRPAAAGSRVGSIPLQNLDLSKYYNPSISASVSNVRGQDLNRNTYNTISDILNSPSKIDYDTVNAPNAGFEDKAGLINELARGARSYMDKFPSATSTGKAPPSSPKASYENSLQNFLDTVNDLNFYKPKNFATPSMR
jgi:hypothetical protein